jgi:hypothetical protein
MVCLRCVHHAAVPVCVNVEAQVMQRRIHTSVVYSVWFGGIAFVLDSLPA